MRVALASRSPQRRVLLEQIGIKYEVLNVDIDERCQENEKPLVYVSRIAKEKARAGKAILKSDLPVLAADTSVVLDGCVLGKATCKKDVVSMLSKLSGRTHEVLTAVVILTDVERTSVSISKVTFRQLCQKEIIVYSNSDEPIDKAGAYAIQGRAAVFIENLQGSYSGVMGLPLFETQQLLNSTLSG